jgi:hypothetical protein
LNAYLYMIIETTPVLFNHREYSLIMKITDYINEEFISPDALKSRYYTNRPYPHIVMDNFINQAMLEEVSEEFPNLSEIRSEIEYNNQREIKFASNGFADISPMAVKLRSLF